ncbi:site-specific integrase [Aquitalea sp. S1-19]|nr:site-specific integrase [Aquitalea sp. S1-19]
MNSLLKVQDKKLQSTQTRGGAIFDPNLEIWAIQEGHLVASLNFSRLHLISTPAFIGGFKKTLLWYAENKSLKHLENMFSRAMHMFRYLTKESQEPISAITSVDLLNYYTAQPAGQKWYLGALAGFLKKWNALSYPGVTTDAIKLINELKIKGNAKGVAILTVDPYYGAFSDIELEAIQAALNEAYEQKSIQEKDYLLAWLFMLLGSRPSQFSLLKVCDVIAPTLKDGSYLYILRVPRVKQRKVPRLEFKERLITPQVGKLLYEYALKIKALFEGQLKDPNQAPLFPKSRNQNQPEGMEFHQTSTSLSDRFKSVLEKLEVFSERTGDLIHITPTRFRRTLGTRAAQEGHGELIIAELLDHSDTQNAGVYVQSTPEIIERIDRAVAITLAPLAQAFAGKIISNESEAIRGNDPSSRIFDPRIDKSCSTMGSCGSHGFCGFMAPISCYTCSSFQAWADGPHEAVLSHLLEERERKVMVTDKRIAAINDRTILAVAEVVLRCQSAKYEGRG